jgi:hypothetical protein
MGKQHNSFSKDIDLLSEAYGKVHHHTPEQIIEEGKNKLSDNDLHQEGILGAIAGGLLGHAIAPGIGADLLGNAGLPAVGGAATGAYLGHKASEDGEDIKADVSAFNVGDIVYGNDGEEVVVDIEQGTVFTMELGRGGSMYGDHPQASPIKQLRKIDINTDFVEDQETGYEAHIDELGAEHGFTGSGKGHATD